MEIGMESIRASAQPEPRSSRGGATRTSRTARWQLDRASLKALLDAFGPDTEQAAKKYFALQERLRRFFEWKSAEHVDELADETLDRLARRLKGSTARTADAIVRNPEEFASGIARLVLYEQWRKRSRRERSIEELKREQECRQDARSSEEARRVEEMSAALDECMAKLTREQEELIRRYYSVEGRTQIDSRKRLAEELGVSMSGLRNRALRIRAELEDSVRERLSTRR